MIPVFPSVEHARTAYRTCRTHKFFAVSGDSVKGADLRCRACDGPLGPSAAQRCEYRPRIDEMILMHDACWRLREERSRIDG